MSSEMSSERVLVVFHQAIAEDVQADIRDKLPGAEVTFYESEMGDPVPSGT